MQGIIIVNPFGVPGQSVKQAERLKDEFSRLGVSTDIVFDGWIKTGLKDGKVLNEMGKCDFAVFLDKDKYLSSVLTKTGVRVFNKHESIRVCDDKGETYLALSGSGLNMPDTVFAPLCYRDGCVLPEETYGLIAKRLGFPLVVKESFGSCGVGVYKVDDLAELKAVSEKLRLKPHLYQKYLAKKAGTDIRAIVIGGKVLTAMERRNENDFRSNIALGGTGRKVELNSEFKFAAELAATVLGLDYCGVDLLFGDDGSPYICEVNSNAFFEGIENATGVNVAGAYAEYIISKLK